MLKQRTAGSRGSDIRARASWLAPILFFAIVALSALSAYYVFRLSYAQDVQRFRRVGDRTLNKIHTGLEAYTTLLRGFAGAISQETIHEIDSLERFVERVDIKTHFPGIQGIGFAYHILEKDIPDLRATLSQQKLSQVELWPTGSRQHYFPIVFLYPLDERNKSALGFDMYSETTRRQAMKKAWETGLPSISGKVTLVQEIDNKKQAGFLIYVPVYQGARVPAAEKLRLQEIVGFSYSPIRADDLFHAMIDSHSDSLHDMWIYDGLRQDENSLLFHTNKLGEESVNARTPRFSFVKTVVIAGRPWTFRFASLPQFEMNVVRHGHYLILIPGLFVAALLSIAVWLRGRHMRHLDEQREWLMVTLSSIGDAVLATDHDERVIFMNPVAAKLLGWSAEDALGKPLKDLYRIEIPTQDHSAELAAPSSSIYERQQMKLGYSFVITRHGNRIPIESRISPIADHDGRVLGSVLVLQDVSTRVKEDLIRDIERIITSLLSQASNFEEVVPQVIQLLCEKLDWDLGALWLADAEGRNVALLASWSSPLVDTEKFLRASKELILSRGVGLPGRALNEGEPVWVTHVQSDPNYARREWAKQCDVKTGVALPIVVDGTPAGVFEFYSKQMRLADPILISGMHSIGIQMGQALQERREELARIAVFEAALDCIITTDHDGRIKEFNTAAESTFGYTKSEVIGRSLSELIQLPGLVELQPISLEEYLTSSSRPIVGTRLEVTGLKKSDEHFLLEFTIVRLPLYGPKLFTAFMRDISDRRRAEEVLQIRGRVLESMTEGVSLADEDGIIVYTNPAEDRMFGYAPGELVGKHLSIQNAYPEEENAHRVREVIDYLRKDGVWTGEWRNQRKDGSTFLTSARISSLMFKDKLYFVCVQQDVTEQKKNEEALRESEERFRVMADSAPVFIWMSDNSKRGIYFNKRWLEFTGRSLTEESGDGWLQSIHPEDLPALEACSLAFEMKKPFTAQFRMRRHDGEYRYLLDTGVPRFRGDGLFEGYIGSCIDITELRCAEEERSRTLIIERRAREEAERLSRMKDEFLASISHELRTPLNAVLGWAQFISRRHSLPPEIQEGLDVIERNARMQSQIIEDLLDMNRIISGKVRLDIQAADITEVIRNALETIRPAAEAKKVRIIQFTASGENFVHADAGRLQQVFWNLLSNAVKFTSSGGEIVIKVEHSQPGVQVSVTDTGEGISSEFLPHIFDRFRQADASTTRRHSGLGLGLAIAKEIVELHGGQIWAKSSGFGQGSTFTVVLPESSSRPEKEDTENYLRSASLNQEDEIVPQLGNLKILVVDDQPDALFLMRQILQDRGATVETAESAEAGLDQLRKSNFDILISDIGMPLVDGYEFIRRVRSLPQHLNGRIPAIALTAFARTEDRLMALQAGFQMHIAKPIEHVELCVTIAAVAERHAA